MAKRNPTIEELQERVGYTQHTVKSGNSRTVLNNLNKPVLSYGVGYSGFVAIYKDSRGYAKGVSYEVIYRNTHMPVASFTALSPFEADRIIKNNDLFKKKVVLKTDLIKQTGKIKTEQLAGYIEYRNKFYDKWLPNSWVEEIYKQKNGQYVAKQRGKQMRLGWFLENYKKVINKKTRNETKIINNTITNKLLSELETQAMISNIKK